MDYRVESELATMADGGRILLCRRHPRGPAVAVKCVRADDATLAEARLHRGLPRHPHLLAMRDVFIVDGMLHMVLDYCPKGDLFAELERQKRFERHTALVYLAQIAAAVQHVHRHGIAHRDLSLENVLLDDDGVAKLCDFGLAVEIATSPEDECDGGGGPVGKPNCMAPEVYAGDVCDPRKADVWSLGMMLFMMITGVPLVHIPSRQDKRFCMLEAYGAHSLVNLWNMEALFTESLLELVELMLEVDPRRRLSIDEVLHAVQIELQGLSDPPPRGAASPPKWEQWMRKLLFV
ncbi:Aste57867_13913 [Aphanomyces stellatus]|uniref:Aste57867_13913 protein n=1 Tax=Aphanomyces stellatus TaxID=120398 RepID=A0A485L107_9STRA|nr:hypothetical protein As57867_013862 [Aphanomyces stellatus]VFT90744.1 Aste57867_13913 [Aphanomyces stellatus]